MILLILRLNYLGFINKRIIICSIIEILVIFSATYSRNVAQELATTSSSIDSNEKVDSIILNVLSYATICLVQVTLLSCLLAAFASTDN